jgi:hypothetical protein
MKLHSQAALTLKQRQEVKRLHQEEGVSIRKLASRFGVNPTTIQRWIKRDSPLDKSTIPVTKRTVITREYRTTVIRYRSEHVNHGPIRIAQELKPEFALANRGMVLSILQQEGLTRPPKKEKTPRKHILLATIESRWISSNCRLSREGKDLTTRLQPFICAHDSSILRSNRIESLPRWQVSSSEHWIYHPLFLVWTDNALEFTMRFSAHPERRCAFEDLAARLGLIHAKCDRGSPWQNGIVERCHRTDNEELFPVLRFSKSEMRRYQLKLWDFKYNTTRPHQALGGRSPIEIYLSDYQLHAASRMLM